MNILERFNQAMGQIVEGGIEEVEDTQGSLSNVLPPLAEIESNLTGLVGKLRADKSIGLEIHRMATASRCRLPLHIGPLMEQISVA